MTSTQHERSGAPWSGIAGDRGVVAVASDAEALRVAADDAVGAGLVTRAALHVANDPIGDGPGAVLRAVGDVAALLTSLAPAADLGLAATASRHLRRHRRIWPTGDPTPGVGTVFFCHSRHDLEPAEFHRRWTTSHGPLALRHHMGMWDYDQVSLLEVRGGPLLEGVEGIAVVQWPTGADLAHRFFDGPEGAAAIRADAESFTDLESTARYLMTETVLVDVDPPTAAGPCWLTDHRSVHFDTSPDDVWGLVGGIVTENVRDQRHDERMLELEIIEGLPAAVVRYRCRYEVRTDGDGCRLDWQPTALVDLGGEAAFGALVDREWTSVRDGLAAALA